MHVDDSIAARMVEVLWALNTQSGCSCRWPCWATSPTRCWSRSAS